MIQHDTSDVADHHSHTQSTWGTGRAGGFTVFRSALLSQAAVAHAFTLRPDDMQLVAGTEDQKVIARRRRLCVALSGEPGRVTSMEQVHGVHIALVTDRQRNRPIDGADGLVTDQPGAMLMALSADCPVIVACDPDRRVLGLAHAGWRGTVRGVTGNLIRTMIEQLGCRTDALLAAVTPSAGPCCYQVGNEVVQQAAERLPEHDRFFARRSGAVFFDLWSANVAQLRRAGVAPERIDLAARCTICDRRFFSYRRDGPTTGHAAMLAMLQPPD